MSSGQCAQSRTASHDSPGIPAILKPKAAAVAVTASLRGRAATPPGAAWPSEARIGQRRVHAHVELRADPLERGDRESHVASLRNGRGEAAPARRLGRELARLEGRELRTARRREPARRDILAAIVREAAGQGTTVLFSSHLLDEVERIADHVALIDSGKVTFAGELEAVR